MIKHRWKATWGGKELLHPTAHGLPSGEGESGTHNKSMESGSEAEVDKRVLLTGLLGLACLVTFLKQPVSKWAEPSYINWQSRKGPHTGYVPI